MDLWQVSNLTGIQWMDNSANKIKTDPILPVYSEGRNGIHNSAFYSAVQSDTRIDIIDTLKLSESYSKSFTVSCWIKYNNSYSVGTVFQFGNLEVRNSQFINFGNNSNLYDLTKWNHYTWVKVNDSISEYFNNSLIRKRSAYEKYINSWFKGRYGVVLDLNGHIDDLLIYNRALSDIEIEKLYKTSITSVQEIDYSIQNQLYPNPAIDVVYLKNDNEISLYNNFGQLVLTGNQSLDISSLPQGVYVAKITDAQGISTTSKLIKK